MRKGNIFTSVCQEFCPQGRGCLPLGLGGGVHLRQTPLSSGRPPSQAYTPSGRHPPPSADTSRQTPAPEMATAVDGKHPTGMHFCLMKSLCCLWYFRLAWVIIVVTAVILFTYQVAERTTDYFGYNTTVSVNIRYVAEVPFPAVTLCNINTFRFVCS